MLVSRLASASKVVLSPCLPLEEVPMKSSATIRSMIAASLLRSAPSQLDSSSLMRPAAESSGMAGDSATAAGVGVGLGVGDGLGEGVGVGFGVGEGFGVGVGFGLGVGDGVGVGVGLGLGVGDGVGVGFGLGVGVGFGLGVGFGVGETFTGVGLVADTCGGGRGVELPSGRTGG